MDFANVSKSVPKIPVPISIPSASVPPSEIVVVVPSPSLLLAMWLCVSRVRVVELPVAACPMVIHGLAVRWPGLPIVIVGIVGLSFATVRSSSLLLFRFRSLSVSSNGSSSPEFHSSPTASASKLSEAVVYQT